MGHAAAPNSAHREHHDCSPARAHSICNDRGNRALAPPHFSGERADDFRVQEWALLVSNAGTKHAFALSVMHSSVDHVAPNSSAVIREGGASQAHPVNAANAAAWRAAGAPELETPAARRSRLLYVPPNGFDFAPFGRFLTFATVRGLGTSELRVARQLRSALAQRFPGGGSPSEVLEEDGYLLGVGPLRTRSRLAILASLRSQRGVTLCGRMPSSHARFVRLCAGGNPTSTVVTLAARSGVACQVAERLAAKSLLYPHLVAGAVVQRVVFTLSHKHSDCSGAGSS